MPRGNRDDFSSIVSASYGDHESTPATRDARIVRDFNASVHVCLAELLAEMHAAGIG